MTIFIVSSDSRKQDALLPALHDDYVVEDNPVRIDDAFVEHLGLRQLGFSGIDVRAD